MYEDVRKIANGQGFDNTIAYLLDYPYRKL